MSDVFLRDVKADIDETDEEVLLMILIYSAGVCAIMKALIDSRHLSYCTLHLIRNLY